MNADRPRAEGGRAPRGSGQPSRSGGPSSTLQEDPTEESLRPYHESSFSYLFSDLSLPAECTFDDVTQTLPELDPLHAFRLPGSPVLAIPVWAMWVQCCNFD